LDENRQAKEGSKEEGASHLFLIRLWTDPSGDEVGSARWHGKVQHVTRGGSYLFDNWLALVGFLRETVPTMGDAEPQQIPQLKIKAETTGEAGESSVRE
jgi:hypothetical protein